MDFRNYLNLLDDISTGHEPQIGDNVDIELGDTLIETYIEDITEDGVVVKVDETALSLLINAKKQLNEMMRMGASTEPIEESKCKVCGMDPCDCDHEEVDEAKRGLWANIHAKRKRIKRGSGERMREPGSKGAPTAQAFKDSQKTSKNEDIGSSLRRAAKRVRRAAKRWGMKEGVAEGFPYDVDHMPGPTKQLANTNCTTCHGRKVMYTLDGKLFADNKEGATKIKCPTCNGTGDKQNVSEGMIKNKMFDDAEKMSLKEFMEIWGHEDSDSAYNESVKEFWMNVHDEDDVSEAKYQGREVELGKPTLTPDGPKKRSVYVRKPNGNVVKVNFGDKKMRIKKSNPARRKSFRARHHCENPGPRWKARYWSCRAW